MKTVISVLVIAVALIGCSAVQQGEILGKEDNLRGNSINQNSRWGVYGPGGSYEWNPQ